MKHFSENLVFFCGLLFMKVFTKNKCTISFVHRRVIDGGADQYVLREIGVFMLENQKKSKDFLSITKFSKIDENAYSNPNVLLFNQVLLL